ncbi:condensation domain-containing protein, partial [Nonomuraea jabiensis]|uniref:condensation domain-containing protein n=1 Tax=Nonomuraea jabiensis TaxID=882448 RepID=UPI003D74B9F3
GPSATYNMPLALRLSGRVDRQALETALHDVVARHESLRTVLPDVDGEPRQVILAPEQVTVGWETAEVRPDELPARLAAAARHEFRLVTDIPVRGWLFATGPEDHVLLILMHHIAGDGWSLSPLARDLVTAYTARRSGQEPSWTPLPVQYADYALWQRHLLGRGTDADSVFRRQLDYWTQALAGLPELVDLPTERDRPPVASHRGDLAWFDIDADVYRAIVRLARSRRATVFMVLQAAMAALITRMGGGSDVPLGVPIAGRTDEALDDLVGYFANTVVLRVDTSGDPAFAELVDRVRDTSLSAYAHQDVPFEHLVERINPRRSTSRHPLFQIAFGFQNTPEMRFLLPGVQVEPEPVSTGTARLDLSINLSPLPDDAGLSGMVEYATDLFDAQAVDTLMRRWVRVLSRWVADPQLRLGDVELLTDEERAALLPVVYESPVSGVTLADLVAGHDPAGV